LSASTLLFIDRLWLVSYSTLSRLKHPKIHYLVKPEHPTNRTVSQSQTEQSTRRRLLLLELASRSAVPIRHSPLRLHPVNYSVPTLQLATCRYCSSSATPLGVLSSVLLLRSWHLYLLSLVFWRLQRLKWSKVLRFLFAKFSSTQVKHRFSYKCVVPALCILTDDPRLELAYTWWHRTLLGLVTVEKTQVGVVQSEPKRTRT
jgi:hypothetical protein